MLPLRFTNNGNIYSHFLHFYTKYPYTYNRDLISHFKLPSTLLTHSKTFIFTCTYLLPCKINYKVCFFDNVELWYLWISKNEFLAQSTLMWCFDSCTRVLYTWNDIMGIIPWSCTVSKQLLYLFIYFVRIFTIMKVQLYF